jgi:hypothetical protein
VATHAAKDDAQRAFRAAVAAARDPGQAEAAAIEWLNDINRINGQSRLALTRIKRERELAESLLSKLASLTDTSEQSEAMALTAMEACRAARAALEPTHSRKDSPSLPVEETTPPRPVVAAPPPPAPAISSAPPTVAPDASGGVSPGEDRPSTDWLVIDIRAPHPQAIVRLMRRDRSTLSALVDQLAGNDATARMNWQLLLSDFVDAVVAAAIEDACLEFPPGNPFWDQFNASESCEVVRGLAALGFRFDGMGAFADARVPTRRDLVMAVGAAGLPPVRVREWPKPEEAEHLFSGVRASADAFIAAGAPALTLGELVRLLGRRAERLTDLWNDWPRVRPLLFSTSV